MSSQEMPRRSPGVVCRHRGLGLGGLSRVYAVLALLLATGVPSLPTLAFEFPDNGAIDGNFDTTVSAGAAMRVSGRDKGQIGISNGGTAYGINGDDGTLNYGKGDFVSLNTKVTHELSLSHGNVGLFGRAFYFYDRIVSKGDTDRTHLPDAAEKYAGHDFELLDAYVDGDFNVGETPVSLRAGNQVINWGESVFIRNGLSSLNPIDVSKLRVAGAEVRDVLMPVPAVNAKVEISDSLSLEGFYQIRWAHTEIEPAGTFFSTNDILGPGGDIAHTGFGLPNRADDRDGAPDPGCPGLCSRVPRAGDRDAPHSGQFGVALRYFAPALNNSELGLYYARIHSRLPVASLRAGTPASIATPTGYAGSMRLFREFPDDIDLAGASVNTEIGATGIALQGEISYRRDQPLQVDDVELLFAGLSPLRNLPSSGPIDPLNRLIGLGTATSQSQLGPADWGEEIAGFRRKDIVQGQAAITKALGPMIGADQVVFLGELGFTQVVGMEDQSELRYEGPGTRTSANPLFTQLGIQPATQEGGFADSLSWGYRAVAGATYNNALGAVSLSPRVAFAHDVSGTAPTPVANFVEGRKTLTLSVEANYLNSWRASLSYTNSFGAEDFNLVGDRDFLSLTASFSF